MGAIDINGKFSSSNWRQTINILRKQDTSYYSDEYGNYVEDEDHYYDGSIYSITDWRCRKMHDASEQMIEHVLDESLDNISKCEGLVIEGPCVGYDIYRFQHEKISNRLNNYTEYFRGIINGCILLIERYGSIKVLISGTYDECIKRASEYLYYNIGEIAIICDRNGNLTRCSYKPRRVKTTTLQDEYRKIKIMPVYNYYWVGCAAT